jgi:hypothetical protein
MLWQRGEGNAMGGGWLLLLHKWLLLGQGCLNRRKSLVHTILDALHMHRSDAADGFESERKLNLSFGVEGEVLLFAFEQWCLGSRDLGIGNVLQGQRPCKHTRCLAHAGISNRRQIENPQIREDETTFTAQLCQGGGAVLDVPAPSVRKRIRKKRQLQNTHNETPAAMSSDMISEPNWLE